MNQEQLDQLKIEVLVKALKHAKCEVGWSDLEEIAVEFLMEDINDGIGESGWGYISARYETTEEMAKKIIKTLDDSYYTLMTVLQMQDG